MPSGDFGWHRLSVLVTDPYLPYLEGESPGRGAVRFPRTLCPRINDLGLMIAVLSLLLQPLS